MVERSELVRRAVLQTVAQHTPAPFYMRREVWEVVLQLLGMGADALGVYDKPAAAKAVSTVVRAANREVIPATQIHTKLNQVTLQLTAQLQMANEKEAELIQAKLEIVMQLRHDLGGDSGHETQH